MVLEKSIKQLNRVSILVTVREYGTHEDERTVLYKTKSLDGTKPSTNPKTKTKTNPNPNTNIMLFRVPSPDLQSSREY